MSEFVPTKAQCEYVSNAGDDDRGDNGNTNYGLYEGNLYALGTDRGSFLVAIDAAEEEMAYLVAEAKAEFGL
jgi:hypothetical protein